MLSVPEFTRVCSPSASNFTRPRSPSRQVTDSLQVSDSDPPRGVPRCLLTSDSCPSAVIYQTVLIDPKTFSHDLQHRLAHVWGQRGLCIDLYTPDNIFYLRRDILQTFTEGYWAFLPNLHILKDIHAKVTREHSRRNPRWQDWYEEYNQDPHREFKFIPIRYMDEPTTIIRRLDPHSQDQDHYAVYRAPYETFPPLRCHVHPYLAIFNAISKLDHYLDHPNLPQWCHEHVSLARGIYECWMTTRVPKLALNAGLKRSAKKLKVNGAQARAEVHDSAFVAVGRSDSLDDVEHHGHVNEEKEEDSPTTLDSVRHPYCRLEIMSQFYVKSAPDPPVPDSKLITPKSSPQTLERLSNPSSSREPLGLHRHHPSGPGEHDPIQSYSWPDAHITLSRIKRASNGIWFDRGPDRKREFVHEDEMDVSEGSSCSYSLRFVDGPVEPIGTHHNNHLDVIPAVSAAPEISQEEQEEEEYKAKMIDAWSRAVKCAGLPSESLEHDPILRKYESEKSRSHPQSSHHSWLPDSLALWPTWTLKRRAFTLAKVLGGQEN